MRFTRFTHQFDGDDGISGGFPSYTLWLCRPVGILWKWTNGERFIMLPNNGNFARFFFQISAEICQDNANLLMFFLSFHTIEPWIIVLSILSTVIDWCRFSLSLSLFLLNGFTETLAMYDKEHHNRSPRTHHMWFPWNDSFKRWL